MGHARWNNNETICNGYFQNDKEREDRSLWLLNGIKMTSSLGNESTFLSHSLTAMWFHLNIVYSYKSQSCRTRNDDTRRIGNFRYCRVSIILEKLIGRDVRRLQLNDSDWTVRSFGVEFEGCWTAKPEEFRGIEINDRKTRRHDAQS